MSGFAENHQGGFNPETTSFSQFPPELHCYAVEFQNAQQRINQMMPRYNLHHDDANPDAELLHCAQIVLLSQQFDHSERSFASPRNLAALYTTHARLSQVLTEYAPSTRTWGGEMFDSILSSREWQKQVSPAFGYKLNYAFMVQNDLQNMSEEKVRSVNIMRLASRIWLEQFPEESRSKAEELAGMIFQKLFVCEYGEFKTRLEHLEISATPCDAFEEKTYGVDKISDFAFAGLPMSKSDELTLRDCMRY